MPSNRKNAFSLQFSMVLICNKEFNGASPRGSRRVKERGEGKKYLNSLEIIFKIPVQQKLAKAEYDLLARQYLFNKTPT